MKCERSQSKTITSHHNKALSVQQWQENCAFRQKTCYTLEKENWRSFFLVDEQKVHGPFTQMGKNNKVHPEKAATKKQFHEILMWYITDNLLAPEALFRDFRGRELALDWQWLGAEVHAHGLHTQTYKHTYTRTCEIMTGQEQGQPLSYLQRTLTAVSRCILRMPQRWQRGLHMLFAIFFHVLCSENPIIWG